MHYKGDVEVDDCQALRGSFMFTQKWLHVTVDKQWDNETLICLFAVYNMVEEFPCAVPYTCTYIDLHILCQL